MCKTCDIAWQQDFGSFSQHNFLKCGSVFHWKDMIQANNIWLVNKA